MPPSTKLTDTDGVEQVDAYIAALPAEVQARMRQVRTVIRDAAPGASEKIGYGIPTFVLEGNLVHYGAFKHHVGFYPGARGIAVFAQELSAWEGAKGSVRFPHDQPLPLDLIRRIVTHRVAENLARAAAPRVRRSR